MTNSSLKTKAEKYLQFLCNDIPSRRVGTQGNRDANEFLAEKFASFGFEVERQTFDCIDWIKGTASISVSGEQFKVQVGPFTVSCRAQAPLVVVSTVQELESTEIRNKILLLRGDIAVEQLMPKNFPFYNPDGHKHIINLLETKSPRAILTATRRNPETAGAVYPFPMIEDGDFDISSAYMTEEEGARLASHAGEMAVLVIEAEHHPSSGFNLVARKRQSDRRVVVSAHIDAKDDTPGALDNAAGVVVLLLLAELLQDYEGEIDIELVPFNGEDHYSAAGEIAYLQANEGKLNQVLLNINMDALGSHEGKTLYSLYECPEIFKTLIQDTLTPQRNFAEGDPWYQGDHMVFVMNGVPAMAITSENFMQILTELAHTPADNPSMVDCEKLVEVAKSLRELLSEIKQDKNRFETS
ncbi:MAG: M28 family peptidase [Anaerolineales bacterium]|jgi:aminopeptidase YwaD